MADNLTFDELLNLEWRYSSYNNREDYHLKVYDNKEEHSWNKNKGVLVNFEQCHADHGIVSHSFTEEVNNKVANLFLYAKEMYKLLDSMDNEEAKELIRKINETIPNLKEDDDE
jgi:hypothetical protein